MAEVEQDLVPEAGVQQVQDGVLDAADVQVDATGVVGPHIGARAHPVLLVLDRTGREQGQGDGLLGAGADFQLQLLALFERAFELAGLLEPFRPEIYTPVPGNIKFIVNFNLLTMNARRLPSISR